MNLKSWLREPLVQFIILGALVFAGYSFWQNQISKADRTITVTMEDAERLATIWSSESGRPPTAREVEGLVAAYIREEALYREARKLGLDEDDTIIKRRLAQKMNFVIASDSEDNEPSDSDLKAFLSERKKDYAVQPKLGFSHIFINADRAPAVVDEAISDVQKKLLNDDSGWRAMGDPFMLARNFGGSDIAETSKIFGPEFAEAVFASDATGWFGPVRSRLGAHLVRIDRREDGAEPDFATIKPKLTADYREYRARERNRDEIDRIVARYKVDIETDAP